MKRIPLIPANDPSEPCRGPEHPNQPAWDLLLALRRARGETKSRSGPAGLWLSEAGQLQRGAPHDPRALMQCCPDGSFRASPGAPSDCADFIDLYAPLLRASHDRPVVVGHLGQSVDSRIATLDGDSYFVTGRENLDHLHRMRALCDAVIVGAGTVMADNPRLTTRLVDGPCPTRVILDPRARVCGPLHIFDDGQAPTVLMHLADHAPSGSERNDAIGSGGVPARRVFIEPRSGGRRFDLRTVLDRLRAEGMHTLFIEGGGVTVSQWFTADLLDRLQIAIAPVLIGDGRPALQLPASISMKAARRPPARLYQMGEDVMWDFDLRG